MDKYDRENLNFLLNSDVETLKLWYSTVDTLDHEYAQSLLTAYAEELKLKAVLLNNYTDIDLSGAKAVLNKFKLKK